MGVVAVFDTGESLARLIEETSIADRCERLSDVAELPKLVDGGPSGLIDAVVIGQSDNTIALCQKVRSYDPGVAVVVCAPPNRLADVRASLRFAPFLPGDVICVDGSDPAAVAREIGSAAGRARKRREMRAALAAAASAVADAPSRSRPSAPYLDRLLDVAPVGVVITDLNHIVTSANARAVDMLCRAGEALAGSNFLHQFDEPSRAALQRQLLAGSGDRPASVWRMSSSGAPQYIEITSTRVSSNRAQAGLLLILQDVTGRALAEARLELALRAGRMGTWRWDALSNRVFWSESLEALYGLPPKSFGGTYGAFLEFVHPEDRQDVERHASQAGRDGQDYEVQFRIRRADGAERWMADKGQVLFDRSGNRIGITGVCWDCTDEMRAEAERERLTQEVQRTTALLDSLFDNAPVGLGFWDRDLRYVRVNQALAEMNGLPVEAHTGKTVAELLPDIDPAVQEAFRRVVDSGEPILNHEAKGATPARPGELRYWSVNYYPVRLGEEIAGAGAVCEEITSRKKVEQEIEQLLDREREARAAAQVAERRAEFLSQASALLSSSLDTDTTFRNVARLAVSFLSAWCVVDVLERDGTRRRVAAEHVDPEKSKLAREIDERYPPAADDPINRVLATGVAEIVPEITVEIIARAARDDEHRGILQQLGLKSYMVVPIRVRERVAGTIALVSTESEPRLGEADLRVAEQLAIRAGAALENARLYAEAEQRRLEAEHTSAQLRRANAELEEFAYVASHDLQEPLRTIGSYAQLLKRSYRGQFDETADEFVERIVGGVRRMSDLISDLLDYSRVSREEDVPENEIDMEDVLGVSLEALKASVHDSGAVIAHDPLPRVRANRRQMEQLLQNLLSNAIKYRREGVVPEIYVSARRDDNGACTFSVRDNGQGFDPAFAQRVFGIFKRLHGRDVPGTGIGLALAKRIIERHRGRIWAESTSGAGSTFYFMLP